MLSFVFVAGCHSSCNESSGAAPVVVPEAGPVLGVPQGVVPRRPIMTHPIMRMPNVGSAAPAPAPSAS